MPTFTSLNMASGVAARSASKPDSAASISKVIQLGLWCYLVVLPLRLQFAVHTLIGNDSPFEARYASLFFGRAFARTFPTTAYSIWNRQWCDKEFLFHVYLAPFCLSEAFLMTGAKLAAALLFAGVLCSFATILIRQRVSGALWWAALLPALSVGWDWRMLMVRSQAASILLILWILFCFEQRRWKPLVVLTFLYTWTYSAPYFAVVLCALMAFGRWLTDRAIALRLADGANSTLAVAPPDSQSDRPSATPGVLSDGRLLLWCIGASVAGLLIHPQTPNQLLTDWTYLVHVNSHAWGLTAPVAEIGSELQSETLREAYSLHPGVLICLVLAWLMAMMLPGQCGKRSRLYLWMTLPAVALYGLSGRFIEYLAPIAVWALALVAADVRPALTLVAASTGRQVKALAVVAAVLLVGLHVFVWRQLDTLVWHPAQNLTQEQAGRWLAQNARPGDLVVPLDWTQFPWLYYWAPDLRYPVGLEPTTMEVVYPDKLRYLEEVRLGRVDPDFEQLRRVFPDARYVVVWRGSGDAIARLATKNYVTAFAEPDAVVYDLENYLPATGAH